MAHVVVSIASSRGRILRHGDFVGRLPGAALCVDDPRVSEAHALVSLRGTGFELLALRRTLLLGGRPVAEAPLFAGVALELVPGLGVEVLEVVLPDRVPALREADGSVHVVHGVASILGPPTATTVSRYEAEALATVWLVGDALRCRLGGAEARSLAVGDVVDVGRRIEVVDIPLRDAVGRGTEAAAVVPRLRIDAAYDHVRIARDATLPLDLHGRSARIVSELVGFGQAAPWHLVAAEIWRDTDDRDVLRERWDTSVRRLRAQLREAGIREDLVAADGGGNVVLRVHPWDEVVDRS